MMTYGYIRVSTREQNGARQLVALRQAVENGVTSGTSSSRFSPEASCTRAQIVTFFYRAQQ